MKIFIGYDPRQPVAFHVLSHSIWKRASAPLSITPLILKQLPMKRRGLTDFTYSRFLVPYLSGFHGNSLFIDSDVLCRADLVELMAYPLAYTDRDVFVVQGQLRFEWPSVMLFNNEKCKTLTPSFVDSEQNALFDLKWSSATGSLPKEFNHLVGYDKPNPDAKLVHFTQGIPCWPETQSCEFASEWVSEFRSLKSTVSFNELMGRSVHAKPVHERMRKAAQ